MGKGPPPSAPRPPKTVIPLRASPGRHGLRAASLSPPFLRAVILSAHFAGLPCRRLTILKDGTHAGAAQLSSLAGAGHTGMPQAPPLRGSNVPAAVDTGTARPRWLDGSSSCSVCLPALCHSATGPLQKLSLPLPACRFKRSGPAPLLKFVQEIPVY